MSAPTESAGPQKGFLTKAAIIDRCLKDRLIELAKDESPFGEQTPGLKSWSYDMRLGREVFLSSDKKVRNLGDREALFIQPGDFALLTTHERLNIPPDLAAFITLRFRIALKGLINVSGFHVDPGYQNVLFFSVYNAGPNPVVIRQGDRIFMVVFSHLDGAVEANSRSDAEFGKDDHLKADWIAAAKGPSVNLVKLNREVERLKYLVDLLIGVLVTVAGTIVVAMVLGVKL